MPQLLKILALSGVLAAGLAAAPTLYAEQPHGPMQGSGGPAMGTDMPQMKKMMEMCHNMMGGGMMGEPRSHQPDQK